MFRQHEMIPSEAMGRDVHLWRFGHYGLPIVVFPSAAGMAHEWDAHGMVESLEDLLDAGGIKLYCTESNVAEAWTRKEDSDPEWRMERHKAYERYVVEELVPWIRKDCESPDIPITVTGTSLGALYSVNFALKHPEVFRWALCMSGRYDTTWLTDGRNSHDIYQNNPMAYVPNLEGEMLERIKRNTFVTLVCGQGKWEDGNIEDTLALGKHLESKGIPSECDLWGRDVSHQWEWWMRQFRYHLEKRMASQP